MRDPGMVVRISDDWLEVRVPKPEGCGMCASRADCRFLGPESAYVIHRLPRPSSARDLRPGDRVTVEIPEAGRNLALGVIFGLPVLLLLGGVGFVQREGPHALVWTIAGGVLVYVAALVASERWVKRSRKLQPRLVDHP